MEEESKATGQKEGGGEDEELFWVASFIKKQKEEEDINSIMCYQRQKKDRNENEN